MRKPGKSRVVNFRLTDEQYKHLQYVASIAGESLCSYARQAVFLVAGALKTTAASDEPPAGGTTNA